LDPIGGKTLPNIIFEISDNAQKMLESIPDSRSMLESAKNVDPLLGLKHVNDQASKKIQILLVWHEFIKELVAVIEMKNMLCPNLP